MAGKALFYAGREEEGVSARWCHYLAYVLFVVRGSVEYGIKAL